ncbi:MAG: DnaJ domain-containing protein, partial [Acetatifactor sp.]|nr:DnaJ domain-containing protein [Acetatifactor sp.]
MDEKWIFAVLGIERTKDQEEIRGAYRRLLQQVNPEDNPEGFKRLREAYEAALKYAGTPDAGEQEIVDDSPVGQWMERVKAVYFSLRRRLDEGEWKRLVREDVCVALDYCEEAKWKLFIFLRDHYQLPSRIFQILDREFHIQADAEKFKEYLPVNFVDYLLRKVRDTNGDTDFTYARFQGEDDADYDGFLEAYHELSAQV